MLEEYDTCHKDFQKWAKSVRNLNPTKNLRLFHVGMLVTEMGYGMGMAMWIMAKTALPYFIWYLLALMIPALNVWTWVAGATALSDRAMGAMMELLV